MKFPKTVYLRLEKADEKPYFFGYPSLVDTASGEEVKTVGVYKLVSEVEIRNSLQYRPKGTKTWAVTEGEQ